MVQAKKLSDSKRLAVYTTIAALVWALLAVIILAAPVRDVLLFLAFQLFAVALPGIALYKLLGLRLGALEAFCVSYGFGFVPITAVYFLFAPFGKTSFIPYALAVIALCALVVLFLKRKQPISYQSDGGEIKLAMWFCSFAAVATFLILSAGMLSPALTGARSYFHDIINGAGLTTSASRGFPMLSLQMAGHEHRYHIFFYSYTASIKLCFGFSSFDIIGKYALITIAPFVAACVAALSKRVLKSNRLAAVACLFVLVVPYNFFVHYLYQDVIGFPFGLAFAVLSVLLFLQARTESGIINRYYIASAVFIWMCLGAKGPLSVTVLFGMCFVLLLDFLSSFQKNTALSASERNKERLSAIARGLLYVSVFFILYFFLYANGSSDSMDFSKFYNASETPLFHFLESKVPYWLAAVIGIPWYAISLDMFIFISLVAMLVWLIQHKGERFALVELCVSGILLSYVFINIFLQMGSSEQYFLTALTPFAYIGGIYCISDLLKTTVKNKKCAVLLLSAALIIAGIFGYPHMVSAYIGNYNKFDMSLIAAVKHSRFTPYSVAEQLVNMDEDERSRTVTPNEYEAYVWLKENTPEDAVIADGRYLKNSYFFTGSVLSERAFFLDGYGFVTMNDTNMNTEEKVRRDTFLRFFFTEEDEGYIPLLSREGCDYLMISQYANPGFFPSDKYCEQVFANDDVAIYKLNEWDM